MPDPSGPGHADGSAAVATDQAAPRRYWAFLSYSHADRREAAWLHRRLESYRVPRELVGQPGRDGRIPARIYPVFVDREELPTSADLSASIREALEDARTLVVLCSPQAVRSRWVEEEIRQFRSLGREDRVLALILSGEPEAESPERACFPPSLRTGGEQGRVEPLAADIRPGQDDRRLALLRIVAGILGVDFARLYGRDRRRRRVRTLQAVGASLLVVAAIAGVWAAGEWRRRSESWQAAAEQSRLLARIAVRQAEEWDAQAALRLASEALPRDLETPERPLVEEAVAAIRYARDSRLEAGLLAHPSNVIRVAWSPDGRRLATGAADKHVRIWSLPGDGPPRVLEAHGDAVTHLEFDPAGERLLSVGGDAARLWAVDSGTMLQSFEDEGQRLVWHARLLGERDMVVTADGHGLRVFRASDGGLLRHMVAPRPDGTNLLARDPVNEELQAALYDMIGDVCRIAPAPGGEHVLTLGCPGQPGRVQRWELASGARGESAGVMALVPGLRQPALDPSGRLAAAALYSDGLVLETGTGALRARLEGHTDLIQDAAFDPTGSRIATGSEDGTVRLWESGTGAALRVLSGQGSAITRVAFSGDGRLLAAGSEAGVVRVWSPRSGDRIADLRGHTGPIQDLAFSPAAARLASASRDASVRLWDLEPLGPARAIPLPEDEFVDGMFSGVLQEHPAARGLERSDVVRRSARLLGEGGWLETRIGFNLPLRGFDLSPSPSRFLDVGEWREIEAPWLADATRVDLATARDRAVASHLLGLVLVDSATGARLRSHDRDIFHPLAGLGARHVTAVDRAGRRLLVAAGGRSPLLFRVDAQVRMLRLRGNDEPLTAAAFAGPEGRVVAATRSGRILAWPDAGEDPELAFQGSPAVAWDVAVAAGGRIVSAADDGGVRAWDPDGRPAFAHADAHPGGARSVAVRGAWLASGGADRRVRIWQLQDGALRHASQPLAAPVEEVVFSADGTRILAGLENGGVALLDAGSAEVLSQAGGPGRALSARFVSEEGEALVYSASLPGSEEPPRLEAWRDRERHPLEAVRRRLEEERLRPRLASPDGRWLLAEGSPAEEGGSLWLLSVPDGSRQTRIPTRLPAGVPFVFAGAGAAVLVEMDRVELWRGTAEGWAKDQALSLEEPAWHANPLAAMVPQASTPRLSPDGRWLAFAEAGRIALWSTEDGATGGVFRDLETVSSLRFGPAGRRLAAVSRSGVLRIWEVPSGRRVAAGVVVDPDEEDADRLDLENAYALEFAPGAERLLVRGPHQLTLWDISQGGRMLGRLRHPDDVSLYGFDPSGRHVFSTSSGQNYGALWDGRSGELLHSLEGHRDEIAAFAFDPSSGVLATGSRSGEVRLWDPDSGEGRAVPGHAAAIVGLLFPAARGELVSVDASGWIRTSDPGTGLPLARRFADAGLQGATLLPDGASLVAWTLDRLLVVALPRPDGPDPRPAIAAARTLLGEEGPER